jgi:hypothetical protein
MQRIMHPTTPKTISLAVQKLCSELVSEGVPLYLKVTPKSYEEANDCFIVVEREVAERGGEVCFGWTIWEWPSVFIEADFHAVWRAPTGELIDITPKQLPIERILFLPDIVRRYEGKQVKNVRRALSADSAVENRDSAHYLVDSMLIT